MKLLNISEPMPKFKIGDKVTHIIFRGAIGTINKICGKCFGSNFSYKADWKPSEIELNDDVAWWLSGNILGVDFPKGYKWEMSSYTVHPENILEVVNDMAV
jgi:hypothetical protein